MNPLRDDLGEAMRTIAKGKSGYLIDDEGSGFSIRYPTKRAAQLQIDRLARAEREAEEDRAAQRVERLAVVASNLAIRAARRTATPEQLAFAFLNKRRMQLTAPTLAAKSFLH